MTTQMKPAYDRVAAFITEDKPNGQTPDKQGALALPKGVEFYNAMLYLQTTTDMTADEIHELGLSEVARIRGEMEKVKEAGRLQGHAGRVLRLHAHGQAFLPAEQRRGRGGVHQARRRLSRRA